MIQDVLQRITWEMQQLAEDALRFCDGSNTHPVGGADDQDIAGQLERRQVHVRETARRIDNDVGEVTPQQLQRGPDVRGSDQLTFLGAQRAW